MIAGNIYGIPNSAFQSWLKDQIYKISSLFFQLGRRIGNFVILRISVIHGLFRGLTGFSHMR